MVNRHRSGAENNVLKHRHHHPDSEPHRVSLARNGSATSPCVTPINGVVYLFNNEALYPRLKLCSARLTTMQPAAEKHLL